MEKQTNLPQTVGDFNMTPSVTDGRSRKEQDVEYYKTTIKDSL